MQVRRWFQHPRQLVVVFLAMTTVTASALSWLGWRMIEQDWAVEGQRRQERLEHAADRATAALERTLSEIEERLSQQADGLASGTVSPGEAALFVIFTPQKVEAVPPERLLYYPYVPQLAAPPAALFAAGEALEFGENSALRAVEEYRKLARTNDPLIRAAALMRLGRVLRKTHQPEAALDIYSQMATLGATPVAEAPAELVARHARSETLEVLRRTAAMREEAEVLERDLHGGARWVLTRGQYEFYAAEAARMLGKPEVVGEAVAMAYAATMLGDQWKKAVPRGRQQVWIDGTPLVLVWRGNRQRQAALIAAPRFFLPQVTADPEIDLALSDPEGRVVAGAVPRGSGKVVRTAVETQLPWTLQAASSRRIRDTSPARARLVGVGLAVMLLFLLAASYLVTRAVKRETDVARLQSEFVSAVSHEFRTPLTSMRQLSELLAAGRVPAEERRQQYYEAIARESRRLQRLVESLLNFGRMEAGARPYHFEAIDPAAVVEGVVSEFEAQGPASARIEVRGERGSARMLADPEAVSLALRNLLDNAVKYSPEGQTVWIDWATKGERIAIRVRDRGLGIAASEREMIFEKFVRGAAAAQANVKGTGVGLAMVRQVVTAHGGEIQVESEPGAGSTFTMLLPVAN